MTRKWLQHAIATDYIPAIEQLQNTPKGHEQAEALNQRIRQQWSDRGSKALSQQQGLMDQTRRVIKDALGENHWSLDYIKFSREENFELNRQKQGRARDRQLQQCYLHDPDAIVARAVSLLESPDWATVAAALSLLSGRRLNEVLKTAEFELKDQWSVTFKGALKRRGETVPLIFDIPLLTTAKRFLEGVAKLRRITPSDANENKVAEMSDRHFADLVPAPAGKDKLYTHLWRSVFCCIATFWYCPKHVDDLLFKAHIMGHFETLTESEKSDGRKLQQRLETFSSERHYRLYEIEDNLIALHRGKRKGIKLGHGGIQPLDTFVAGMPEHQPEPKERKKRSSFRIWQDDKGRLNQILEQFKDAGTQQPERFHAFLNWFESQQKALTALQPEPTEVTSTKVEEKISMQSQAVATQDEELDQPELDAIEITSAPTIPSPQVARIDQLIDAIAQLVEVQTAVLQSQVNPPATPASATKPKATSAETHETVTPSQTTETSKTEQKETSQPRQRAGAAETTERINQAINAIFAYNDALDRKHTEKWAIGINTLKAFAKSQEAIVAVIGGKNRKGETIQGTRQAEIQLHHQKHQLDPDKHNYVHRGKTKIEDVVRI